MDTHLHPGTQSYAKSANQSFDRAAVSLGFGTGLFTTAVPRGAAGGRQPRHVYPRPAPSVPKLPWANAMLWITNPIMQMQTL